MKMTFKQIINISMYAIDGYALADYNSRSAEPYNHINLKYEIENSYYNLNILINKSLHFLIKDIEYIRLQTNIYDLNIYTNEINNILQQLYKLSEERKKILLEVKYRNQLILDLEDEIEENTKLIQQSNCINQIDTLQNKNKQLKKEFNISNEKCNELMIKFNQINIEYNKYKKEYYQLQEDLTYLNYKKFSYKKCSDIYKNLQQRNNLNKEARYIQPMLFYIKKTKVLSLLFNNHLQNIEEENQQIL